MSIAFQPVTLQAFLQLSNIEESPAWELLNGEILQKPMPTFYHSRIQKRLVNAINNTNCEYEAFPELRCVLQENSIVPDITVIHRSSVPVGNEPVSGAPDWMIEILSLDQSTTKLIAKLQACIQEGTRLGWLIDSKEQVVLVFFSDRPLIVLDGDRRLPVLDEIDLDITPSQIFEWVASRN